MRHDDINSRLMGTKGLNDAEQSMLTMLLGRVLC
jgi:hypothetical protein